MSDQKKEETPAMNEQIIALLEGDSGTGKTFFLSQIPNALFLDTDLGGGATYLDPWIERVGSVRVQVATYEEAFQHLDQRLGKATLHALVIDHLSMLHENSVARFNPSGEADFGRSSKQATGQWRKLREKCRLHRLHLFVAAHTKVLYQGGEVVGVGPDGPNKLEADFHQVLRLSAPTINNEREMPSEKHPAIARVVKWRRHPADPRGVVPATFPFTIEEFQKVAGFVLAEEGPRPLDEPITKATQETYDRLLAEVELPAKVLDGWNAAPADSVGENTLKRRIEYLNRFKEARP